MENTIYSQYRQFTKEKYVFKFFFDSYSTVLPDLHHFY